MFLDFVSNFLIFSEEISRNALIIFTKQNKEGKVL